MMEADEDRQSRGGRDQFLNNNRYESAKNQTVYLALLATEALYHPDLTIEKQVAEVE